MICNFGTFTDDPHLWEALDGLPGLVTASCIFVANRGLAQGPGRTLWLGPGYFISAVGTAESASAWNEQCHAALDEAGRMNAKVMWIVEDLSLEGI